ncbi:hypothetical protein BGZ83_006651 [Gryganskiella cystojenkinii]|nr:hypothetical protein BGZ83_006651 [Gryganskiella cystojenkinii]
MTFSIPQPIPSRSSHPVHAHQRPSIRRSQSHNIATVATSGTSSSASGSGAPNPKFGITHLLASALHQDIGGDLSLADDDIDDTSDLDDNDEEDEDDCEEDDVRQDSGHYTSVDLERGIPIIGKPSFLYRANATAAVSGGFSTNRSSNSHLYGTYGSNGTGSGSMERAFSQQLNSGSFGQERRQHQHLFSHSHSNSDSHSSVNLMANNLKSNNADNSKNKNRTSLGAVLGGSDKKKQGAGVGDDVDNQFSINTINKQHSTNGHNNQLKSTNTGNPNHTWNDLSSQIPHVHHVEYQSQPLLTSSTLEKSLPDNTSRTTPPLFNSSNSPSPLPSSSTTIVPPQSTLRKETSVENATVSCPFSSNGPSTPAPGPTALHHSHPHPNISIDTSKARLIKTSVPTPKETTVSTTTMTATTTKVPNLRATGQAVKRAVSSSALPRSRGAGGEGQLSLGLRKEEKNITAATTTISSSTVSNSSTRPLMMASQSRLSSALPPTPSYNQHSLSTQEQTSSLSVLLPALSPSSPRANTALVNSLEQLSVSWKAPEQTPSFPINRLHRSRTISSGTRPSINSSFDSNGTFGSSHTSANPTSYFQQLQHQQQQQNLVSPSSAMVTSSSYSSLPYSPAVAFLSNFVDATAPQMVAPDEEGEQVGDFIMGKVIGHGGFSIVREAFAIHLDGLVAQVAVKIVKTQTGMADNDRVQRMLDKEIAIWSRLSHPNVLPFVAMEKLPESTFVFCELCTGGNLLDYITKQESASVTSYLSPKTGLGEIHARLIFNQVAEAVRYLHEEKRIVHRDIKLENILRHEDGTWKVCDFGLAEYQNDEAALYFGSPVSPTIYNPRATASTCAQQEHGLRGTSPSSEEGSETMVMDEENDMVGGSLAYCSPEQLRSQKPLRCPSSDVWSLGVVLYALLTGRLPFQDEYEPRLQYQILNGRYEDPTECSPEARELLRNMFRSKPEDRWRVGQVMDSPWCMGTSQEESSCFDDYGSGIGSSKMNNNFFATFRM